MKTLRVCRLGSNTTLQARLRRSKYRKTRWFYTWLKKIGSDTVNHKKTLYAIIRQSVKFPDKALENYKRLNVQVDSFRHRALTFACIFGCDDTLFDLLLSELPTVTEESILAAVLYCPKEVAQKVISHAHHAPNAQAFLTNVLDWAILQHCLSLVQLLFDLQVSWSHDILVRFVHGECSILSKLHSTRSVCCTRSKAAVEKVLLQRLQSEEVSLALIWLCCKRNELRSGFDLDQNLENVQRFLDHGADPLHFDSSFHTTPLHRAARKNDLPLMQLLLKHCDSSKLNAKGRMNLVLKTVLPASGYKLLLQHGARPTSGTWKYICNTTFGRYEHCYYKELIQDLLDSGGLPKKTHPLEVFVRHRAEVARIWLKEFDSQYRYQGTKNLLFDTEDTKLQKLLIDHHYVPQITVSSNLNGDTLKLLGKKGYIVDTKKLASHLYPTKKLVKAVQYIKETQMWKRMLTRTVLPFLVTAAQEIKLQDPTFMGLLLEIKHGQKQLQDAAPMLQEKWGCSNMTLSDIENFIA